MVGREALVAVARFRKAFIRVKPSRRGWVGLVSASRRRMVPSPRSLPQPCPLSSVTYPTPHFFAVFVQIAAPWGLGGLEQQADGGAASLG